MVQIIGKTALSVSAFLKVLGLAGSLTLLCSALLCSVPLAERGHAAPLKALNAASACPKDPPSWARALSEVQRNNLHSYTFFWLASGRSSSPVDVKRSLAYASQAHERSAQLLKCDDLNLKGRDLKGRDLKERTELITQLEVERRAAAQQMDQLKGVLLEASESAVGALPHFLSLTHQELFYNYYDDPRETAVLNGLNTFLDAYNGPLTRKLLEPYILLMVCALPSEKEQSEGAICAPQGAHKEHELKAVARHYLNEHSKSYVLTPTEEGRHIKELTALRDDFAHFLDSGERLKPRHEATLAQIARAYHVPSVSLLMVREQDDVRNVNYFGVHFYTYTLLKEPTDKPDEPAPSSSSGTSHVSRPLMRGADETHGLVYVDGFAEDVRARKRYAWLWLFAFVFLAPSLWVRAVRRWFPDPYTQQVSIDLGVGFTGVALLNAYLSTMLVGDLGMSNTEYASWLKITLYLGALVLMHKGLCFVVFNLLASKWSRLSQVFYNRDVIITLLFSVNLSWLGLFVYYVLLRDTLSESLPWIAAHLALTLWMSVQSGRAINQYLKTRDSLSLSALSWSLLFISLCELSALTWNPTGLALSAGGLSLTSLLLPRLKADHTTNHTTDHTTERSSRSSLGAEKIRDKGAWVTNRAMEVTLLHWVNHVTQNERAGRVTVTWLSGHRGIGKSSLIKRFHDQLTQTGHSFFFLEGGCGERSETAAYLCPPFAEALKGHLGYKYFENPQRQLSQLNQKLNTNSLLGGLKPVQIFTELFGTIKSEDIEENLEALKDTIYRSFKEQLRERAVVFVISEVQLIDNASQALLLDLVERLQRDELARSLTLILTHQQEHLSKVKALRSKLSTLLSRHHQEAQEAQDVPLSQSWELVTTHELDKIKATQRAQQVSDLPPSEPHVGAASAYLIKVPSVTELLRHKGLSYAQIMKLYQTTLIKDHHTPHVACELYALLKERWGEGADISELALSSLNRAELTTRLTTEVQRQYEALEEAHPHQKLKRLLLISAHLTMFTSALDVQIIQELTGQGELELLEQLNALCQAGWLKVIGDEHHFHNSVDHKLLLAWLESDPTLRPLARAAHVCAARTLFERWSRLSSSDLSRHQGVNARTLVTAFKHAQHVAQDQRAPLYELAREVTKLKPGQWAEVVFEASLYTLYGAEMGFCSLSADDVSDVLSQYLWYYSDTLRLNQVRLYELLNSFINNKLTLDELNQGNVELVLQRYTPSEDAPHSLEQTIQAHLAKLPEGADRAKTLRLEIAYQYYLFQKERNSSVSEELKMELKAELEAHLDALANLKKAQTSDSHSYSQSFTPQESVRVFALLTSQTADCHTDNFRELLAEVVSKLREDRAYSPVWFYAHNFEARCIKGHRLNDEFKALRARLLSAPPQGKEAQQSTKDVKHLSEVITDHRLAVESFNALYDELRAHQGQYDLRSTRNQYADALYDLVEAALLNLNTSKERDEGCTYSSLDESPTYRQALAAEQKTIITAIWRDWELYRALIQLSGLELDHEQIKELAELGHLKASEHAQSLSAHLNTPPLLYVDSPFTPLIPLCLTATRLIKQNLFDEDDPVNVSRLYSRLGWAYTSYLEVLFWVMKHQAHTQEVAQEVAQDVPQNKQTQALISSWLRSTYEEAARCFEICQQLISTHTNQDTQKMDEEFRRFGLKRLTHVEAQFASAHQLMLNEI